jgi:2,4-diaminopentanoate dehydrogenase
MSMRREAREGRIRVAQFGLGPIGLESVRLAASREWIEVVGGVDIDPAKAGRSLGELSGVESLQNALVYPSFQELASRGEVDVVLHTAGSRAASTIEQIEPMVERGVSVASTCEEMLYPWLAAAEAAERLDRLCQKHGARVVGAGVNPGFVLDVLPVCLTGVCREVRGVYGERVVDASTRREPLQRKIGSGMAPEAFRRRWTEGTAGHAGFPESLTLIAHALGWRIGRIEQTCEPVVAQRPIQTRYFTVEAGLTCGLHQTVRASTGDGRRIELDLKMYLDASDPHDAVRIDGDPPVQAVLPGGVAGDIATISVLVNVVPKLLAAPAGLRLMTELAIPACTGR